MKQYWLDEKDGLIIEGDILDALALLEDESVEAIVTDPPYELKFMGKTWDQSGVSFQPETWAACLRVLKPGGHMVVFGGTRTHHRMWCAIEDSGFEVRDALLWLYGQGFPKSLDVSKAIDKVAGAEREVVGVKPGHEGFAGRGNMSSVQSFKGTLGGKGGFDRPWMDDPEKVEKYHMDTAPATDDAKEWEGWGTALKPACEPILLARKPLSEKTVAANVLKWGTGALNINATRISTEGEVIHTPKSDPAKREGAVGKAHTYSRISKEDMAERQQASVERANTLGRWPANVLIHCICDDPQPVPEKSRKRKGEPSQDRRYDKKGGTDFAAKPGARREGGGFIHQPDCPAGMLDAQSGERKTTWISPSHTNRRSGEFMGALGHPGQQGYNDYGGASRFFYCPKAAKAEKGDDNTHPTVKPIALMRWLVRLVTPPDGVVLDPFCGSGSTLIAATEEGFGFIGVDISKEYVHIALNRLEGGKT